MQSINNISAVSILNLCMKVILCCKGENMLIIYLIEITLHVCSKLKVSGKMKVKVLFFSFFFYM